MRTLGLLLVSLLAAGCGADAGNEVELNFDGLEIVPATPPPAPRSPLRDAAAEEVYSAMRDAMDPNEGFNTVRYVEFDWVLSRGVELLRRHYRYSVWEGDYRVETDANGQHLVVTGNWDDPGARRVWMDAEEVYGDSASFLGSRATKMFESDANLLLSPFRLALPGVNTRHMGQADDSEGNTYEVLQQEFDDIGGAEEPKFNYFVDPETHLIVRSQEYAKASDEQPGTFMDWSGWQQFGPLLLSTERVWQGESRIHFENIRVEVERQMNRFDPPSG